MNRLSRAVYFTIRHHLRRRLATMSHAAPILSVCPSRALVDEKFKVVVENLPPGSPVTLHALHFSEDKDYWEAYGHYISDSSGTASVAEDMSFGGTYTGKEPMGLMWSLRPIPGSRTGLRLRKMQVYTPMVFNISVYSGHLNEGFMERTPLATEVVERWYMAPGVKRISTRERGVRGTLFIPPGPGPFPGLLDMWGGGGGLIEYRSALLASHGYVSLALEYLAADETETGELEFSYFETAFNLIKEHPQVIPDRIALFGLSLGSIMSIYLASESTVVKPHCCVCVSVSHFFPRGKKIKDFNSQITQAADKIRMDENNHVIWRDMGLSFFRNPKGKVDVGNINCPLLLLNGEDDQNWPSVECADDIEKMLTEAGKEHLLTKVHYPDAGHLIEPPYSPHFRATNFIVQSTKQKVILLWGGQSKPHSDAQEDSWRRILSFLNHHLYSSKVPKAKM